MNLAMVRAALDGARPWGRPAARALAATGIAATVSACAIPPVISVAKLAADGVLFASTGKTSTDHGLSLAVGKDCETFRVLSKEDVCQEEVVARAEPLPAAVARDRAAIEALALTVPLDNQMRLAMADQALDKAFAPRAAVSADRGGLPVAAVPPRAADPARLAALAPPVRDDKATRRGVPARPGMIKADAAVAKPAAVTKVAARDLAPAGVPAPKRAGAVERLGRLLGSVFGAED